MSTTCPHCGAAIDDDQPMCGACQALFQSHDAPPPPAQSAPSPLSSPKTAELADESAPLLQRKAQPLSGWALLGIGVGMYLFAGLMRATIGQNPSVVTAGFGLLLVLASWVVGILGIVRLFTSGRD
ncbi:MAG: zinc ribbon domain-containing protein [Armatimonadota bacterium]